MVSRSLNRWLKAIKVLLWLSVIGFSYNVVNTTGLLFTTNQMYADVMLSHTTPVAVKNGVLKQNSGVFEFKSDRVLDRIIFKHVYGYHDFMRSVFTLVTCCVLLITVNGIKADSPFTLKVARRIMLMGVIFIVYSLMSVAAGYYIYSRVKGLNDQFTPVYMIREEVFNIKVGVFIIILAFIYRIGAAYQEENQLTV